jgi:large subunit ribosomal protein L24
MKFRIKTGDQVKIIAGKDKGKTGKVIQTFPGMNRVVVEGVNAATRHLRTQKAGEKGQKIEFFMPMNASNVLPLGDDGKTRRHRQSVKNAQSTKSTKKAQKAA